MNPESSETITKRNRKISKTNIAYSAGMLDADGCISGIVRGGGSFCLDIAPFTGNCRKTAEWLQSLWGGIITIPCKGKNGGPPCFMLRLRKNEAVRFLKLVKQYLRIKRTQAECALAYHSLPRHAPAKRQKLVEKIQNANQRFKIESRLSSDTERTRIPTK